MAFEGPKAGATRLVAKVPDRPSADLGQWHPDAGFRLTPDVRDRPFGRTPPPTSGGTAEDDHALAADGSPKGCVTDLIGGCSHIPGVANLRRNLRRAPSNSNRS